MFLFCSLGVKRSCGCRPPVHWFSAIRANPSAVILGPSASITRYPSTTSLVRWSAGIFGLGVVTAKATSELNSSGVSGCGLRMSFKLNPKSWLTSAPRPAKPRGDANDWQPRRSYEARLRDVSQRCPVGGSSMPNGRRPGRAARNRFLRERKQYPPLIAGWQGVKRWVSSRARGPWY
jgi:hypothetical protein